jgi:hypothetical protein
LENSLVDSNIIKLIEETVKDDQELEKELNIFDVCQQKKGRVLSEDMYIISLTDTIRPRFVRNRRSGFQMWS